MDPNSVSETLCASNAVFNFGSGLAGAKLSVIFLFSEVCSMDVFPCECTLDKSERESRRKFHATFSTKGEAGVVNFKTIIHRGSATYRCGCDGFHKSFQGKFGSAERNCEAGSLAGVMYMFLFLTISIGLFPETYKRNLIFF